MRYQRPAAITRSPDRSISVGHLNADAGPAQQEQQIQRRVRLSAPFDAEACHPRILNASCSIFEFIHFRRSPCPRAL